jgi:hypothetical protein
MTSPAGIEQYGATIAAPFLTLLPIDGVAISILNSERRATLVHASDGTAALLEEAHFDLGEGPVFDSFENERAVLVPDLASDRRWPLFLSRAQTASVGSVFVFPLTFGAAGVGTVLCYRAEAGELSAAAAELGTDLSRAVAGPAFRQAMLLARDEQPHDSTPIELRREVHQATGMVLLQLDVSATDAFARMRAYAFSHGITLREVAHDVVARDLDFSTIND